MQRRHLIAGMVAAALMGPAAAEEKTITITACNPAGKPLAVTLPYDPQRIAVADLAALDTLNAWGLGKRIVALTKAEKLPYLGDYFKPDNGITNLGSLREIDFEALMAAEPDVILISGRLRRKFADLQKIAPVVYLPIDWQNGVFQSFEHNTWVLATIFGREKRAEADVARLRSEITDLAKAANHRTALVGMVTASHVNLLGDKARCSLIGNEMGFENLAKGADATHGSEASFEYLLKLNPEYREGAKLAADVLDNELIASTRAKKEGKIIYVNPQAWYLGEGGIRSMEIMIDDVRRALKGAAS